MLPDLPGWDSLPTVTRYHSWAEMAGIAFLLLLVVAEIVAYRYGHRKDDLTEQQQEATDQRHTEEIARLHRDTAAMMERAAGLENETAKAKERAAELALELEKRKNRSITPDQQMIIAPLLTAAPKGKVYVQPSFFDAEARQFAEQIIAALKAGGFNPEELPQRPNKPIGYTSPGAWIWVHSIPDLAAPHAKPIQDAFKAAGWYFDGQPHPDLLEPGEILIAVSSHP
jgi:hypothetical protein